MRALAGLVAIVLPACGLRAEVLSEIVFDASTTPESSVDAEPDAPAIGNGLGLSVGQYHSCALEGGAVFCWGAGRDGALGNGDEADRTRPTRVALEVPVAEIAGGAGHTCARADDGSVFCWGANESGQLGLGDVRARLRPEKLVFERSAARIESAFSFTCAIATDRSLWCWGQNTEGMLGLGDGYPGAPKLVPTQVGTATWRAIAAGQGHACGIQTDGSLWCWGRNTSGQLGLGGGPIQLRTPTRVGSGTDWTDVDAGQDTTCALREDASLWCWGANFAGQVGQAGGGEVNAPRRVGGDADWVAVDLDTFSTCARKRAGSLWCFGRNDEGQLGVGPAGSAPTPRSVGVELDWIDVAVGRFHACARRRSGAVLCTGQNNAGQLGTGDRDGRDLFTPVVR
jgi:alpha-tubulin suppressor-like RCC1 family protein